MLHERLTEKNFLLWCSRAYDKTELTTTDEFFEDINRITYIKKLVFKYLETGELKERLILNHIIILNNCFAENLAKILFLKFEQHFSIIKPFLVFINALPKVIYNVSNYKQVHTDLIPMDMNVVNALRKHRSYEPQ
jgi:hypothetical protein